MRIGIDYHPALTHAPGVGRYSRELVRALVRLEECPELFLADVGKDEATIGEPALGLADAPRRPKLVSSRRSRKMFKLLTRSADRMLGGVDLFHRMLPDWPPVSAARELLPVAEFPAEGSEEARAQAEAARRCGDVLVFSEHAAGEAVRRFDLDPDRVHRVPVGCDHWLRDLGDPPERKDPPQILVLGALRTSRRPDRVLRAIEVIKKKRRPVQVRFVGARGDLAEAFLNQQLGFSVARDWVLWNEFAPEPALPGIVASSTLLVHLSEGEATAVTPLEAFSLGVQVVASRLPAFEEALGGEASLVDPAQEEDPEALAEVILEAVEAGGDEEARARRRALAAAHTWGANARATVEVWRRMLA